MSHDIPGWLEKAILAWVRRNISCNVCFCCCNPFTHAEIKSRANSEGLMRGQFDNICPSCLECPVDEDDRDEEGYDWDKFVYRYEFDASTCDHVFRHNRDGTISKVSYKRAKADARRSVRRQMRKIEAMNEDPIADGRFAAWARGCGA